MIVRHYLELLRYYRRLVVLIVGGITSATLAVCLLFLFASPIYVGEAKILLMPTESELTFTHDWLGSGTFDPASIMVQTHEQYLFSRTVAERALDNLLAESSDKPQPTGLEARVHAAFTAFRTFLWRSYATLNYGTYLPVSERQQLLNDLQDAIDFEWIEGSFVALLSASYSDPQGAARIANAVAEAYVEIKQETIAKVAKGILAQLRRKQDAKIAQLQALTEEEARLNAAIGIQDQEAARSNLLDAIHTTQDAIRADELELAKLVARRQKLVEDEKRLRSLGLAGSIERDIALADADRVALETSLATRRQSAADLQQRLVELTTLKEKLIGIEDQKQGIAAALLDLNQRQTNLEMVQNTAVDQVRVIDPAVPPVYPQFPKVLLFTGAALVGSMLLAAFVIVALDTFSDTVKTSADLRRLFGERGLARLPAGLCRKLASARRASMARMALGQDTVIDDLATHLRLLGAVFPQSILVVGLHSSRAAACATGALAAACAASGMDVRTEGGRAEPAAAEDGMAAGGAPGGVPAGYEGGKDIAVRDLGLAGRDLDWFQVTQDLNVLVCAVVPGEATETLLARLDAEAEGRRVPLMLFILCDV